AKPPGDRRTPARRPRLPPSTGSCARTNPTRDLHPFSSSREPPALRAVGRNRDCWRHSRRGLFGTTGLRPEINRKLYAVVSSGLEGDFDFEAISSSRPARFARTVCVLG